MNQNQFVITCTNLAGDNTLTVLITTDTGISVEDFTKAWEKNHDEIKAMGEMAESYDHVFYGLSEFMSENFPGVSCTFTDIAAFQLYGVDM